MPNVIILIRSHALDSHIIEARRSLQSASDYPVYLMIHDETGAITAPDDGFMFSSRDVERLGISTFSSPHWAWHMGDCPIYLAFDRFPAANFAMMLDYDVRLNLNVDELLSRCVDTIDFFALYAGFYDKSWGWHTAASHWFTEPRGSYFPMVGVSRRLADSARRKRIDISKAWIEDGSPRDGRANYMLNCEALVPSVCHEMGYAMADLQKIIPGWDSKFFTGAGIFPWEAEELNHIPAIHPSFPKRKLAGYYKNIQESRYMSDKVKASIKQQMDRLVSSGYFSPDDLK